MVYGGINFMDVILLLQLFLSHLIKGCEEEVQISVGMSFCLTLSNCLSNRLSTFQVKVTA